MYKAVNINEDTYLALQRISTQLQKPKAQVVEALVKGYGKAVRQKERARLEKFNAEMRAKIKALKFSKRMTFTADTVDADFATLSGTNYGK